MISYIIDNILYYIPSFGFNSNIYVFVKKALFDTGADSSYAQKILTHFKSYDINIEKIIITHTHPDHSGNSDIFQKAFNADVYVHESVVKKFKYGDKIHGLKDGEILKIDEKNELEVIFTPGHTMADICLYNAEHKILFSGDCIFADGNIGRTDFPGASHAKLIESIEKLTHYDVEILCAGHMNVIRSNGNKHVKMSLQFAKRTY